MTPQGQPPRLNRLLIRGTEDVMTTATWTVSSKASDDGDPVHGSGRMVTQRAKRIEHKSSRSSWFHLLKLDDIFHLLLLDLIPQSFDQIIIRGL
jgi:hypothetical protein